MGYNPKKIANKFVNKILFEEPWFTRIEERDAWDLIVLAGSVARQDYGSESDIDLFLVIPHDVQRKHSISPVHEYDYKQEIIDVSKVSSEKLKNSAQDKRNLYWWHKTEILHSNNDNLESIFEEASKVTTDDLQSLLWTNFCLFQINSKSNLNYALSHDDFLGARSCFFHNIELAMDVILYSHEIFIANKKRGVLLKEVSPDYYEQISSIAKNPSADYAEENNKLERIFFEVLLDNGFTNDELLNWHQNNLEKFLHQAY